MYHFVRVGSGNLITEQSYPRTRMVIQDWPWCLGHMMDHWKDLVCVYTCIYAVKDNAITAAIGLLSSRRNPSAVPCLLFKANSREDFSSDIHAPKTSEDISILNAISWDLSIPYRVFCLSSPKNLVTWSISGPHITCTSHDERWQYNVQQVNIKRFC